MTHKQDATQKTRDIVPVPGGIYPHRKKWKTKTGPFFVNMRDAVFSGRYDGSDLSRAGRFHEALHLGKRGSPADKLKAVDEWLIELGAESLRGDDGFLFFIDASEDARLHFLSTMGRLEHIPASIVLRDVNVSMNQRMLRELAKREPGTVPPDEMMGGILKCFSVYPHYLYMRKRPPSKIIGKDIVKVFKRAIDMGWDGGKWQGDLTFRGTVKAAVILYSAFCNKEPEDGEGEEKPLPEYRSENDVPLEDALRGVSFGVKELPRAIEFARKTRKIKSHEFGNIVKSPFRIPGTGPIFGKMKRGKPQGTVLIDTSGSMRLSSADIDSLLSHIPFGTVAVYDGRYDGNEKFYGEVRVIARDGRRATQDAIARSKIGGGNIVDVYALDWLSRQGKSNEPRVWICDGGVTGKNDNSYAAVRIECNRIAKRGRITRHGNVNDAREYFRTKQGGRR